MQCGIVCPSSPPLWTLHVLLLLALLTLIRPPGTCLLLQKAGMAPARRSISQVSQNLSLKSLTGEGQLPGQSSLSPTASAPSHSKHPGNACQMNMSSHPISLTVSRERTLIVFLHLQSRTHQVWWCAPVLTPMAKVILSYTGDSGPARASEGGARLSGRCPERSDRASKGQEAKGRQSSRGLTHGALGVKKKVQIVSHCE